MTRNLELEKEWKTRLEEHKKSGLSIKAWCAQHALKATTFHYWVSRLKLLNQTDASDKTQFAEVILYSDSINKCNAKTMEQNELHLSYGLYKIGIPDRFNPITLAELLKVLQSQ